MSTCECGTFTMQPSVSSDFNVPIPSWDNAKGSISKDIRVFNMWEGELEVVDGGLNNEPLIIAGVWRICGEWEGLCFPLCFPLCFSRPLSDKIDDIHDIMNDGEEITIDDLNDCLNGVYVINSFDFKTIKGAPSAFTYVFVMEKVRNL